MVPHSDSPRSGLCDQRRLMLGARRQRRSHIGLAVRHERKGIRTIRMDAELPGERTSLGQLDRLRRGGPFYFTAANVTVRAVRGVPPPYWVTVTGNFGPCSS